MGCEGVDTLLAPREQGMRLYELTAALPRSPKVQQAALL